MTFNSAVSAELLRTVLGFDCRISHMDRIRRLERLKVNRFIRMQISIIRR